MPSSPDDALIDTALQDFSCQLQSVFPLRHFTEFHDEDEEQLKEKILQLQENVSKTLFSKVWNRDREYVFSLLRKLRERMSNDVIAEWKAQNKKHKMESVSFFQRRAEMLSEDFQNALEDQVLLNPDMAIESFQNFVDVQKVFHANYFDGIWNAWSSQLKEERKAKMVRNLDTVGEEVLEKHRQFLERKSVDEGVTSVDEVKVIMEKSRQLKSYVKSRPDRVSKRYLKAEVEVIKSYLLNGKGSTLRESQKEIYSNVVQTLEDGITFLMIENGAEENANEDLTQWVEQFVLKLQSYCCNGEGVRDEPQEIQREREVNGMNGCDSSDRPSCGRMQQILQKDPGGLRKEEVKSKTRTHNDCSLNNLTESNAGEEVEGIPIVKKSSTKADGRLGPVTAPTVKKRIRPIKLPLANKNRELICDYSHAGANGSPVSKKRRTGDNTSNVSRKTVTKADSSLRGEISRGNRKTNDSAQATPSRRSSRLKKKFHATDRTLESTGKERSAFNKFSSSSLHGEMPEGEYGSTETSGTNTLKHSSARQPQSTPQNTDKSGRNLNEGNELCGHGPPFYLDKIIILEGDPPTYKCDLCKKRIKKQGTLRFHGKFCYRARRPHKCDYCDKRFYSKALLVKHSRMHTGERPYKCPMCDKQFIGNDILLAHIRSHTARFTCEKCKQSFNYRHSLASHMLNHEGKLPLGCSYCDQRCSTMHNMLEHMLTHSDERPYNCVTCNKKFCTKYQLTRHIQSVHQQPKEDAEKQANDAGLEYLRKVTNNPNYDGDISSTVVLSHAVKKANLKIPDQTDRASPTQATPSRSSYTGPNRSNRFEQITTLGGDPPTYKCDACSNEIKRKCDLKYHGKYCNKNGHKCLHCGKLFFKTSAFVNHQRIHTGEKPFKCPTCSKGFAGKGNLHAHIITHAVNSSFPCRLCDRKFKHSRSLNLHMMKHEGKLPFGCSYCDRRFPTLTKLKEHIITHTDERIYKCPACERMFYMKHKLAQHIHAHHHQPKEDATKLANEAATAYLKTVTNNPNYDGDISNATVLSYAIKKAKLKVSSGTA